MTNPGGEHAARDKNVPGEARVDRAIDDQLARTSSHAHIADPASPGASYVQAEVVALRTAIVAILDILEDAGLMPAS